MNALPKKDMADPIFNLTFDDREVVSLLRRIQQRFSDLRPTLKLVGEYLLLATDKRFETETDPSGKKWKSLSPYTLRLKRERGQILKILQATGRMRSSITYQVYADKVIVGTNVSYAYRNQAGVGVTKREFLGISDEDRAEILQILNSKLLENI